MARPKGSTSALAARASRRNLQARGKATSKKSTRPPTSKPAAPPPASTPAALAFDAPTRYSIMADRREEARLAREEAQAIREQAKARHEAGELCLRSEAVAEVQRLQRLVRAELDRALAYLDPGLSPDVRVACEATVRTTIAKLRHVLAGQVDGARPQPDGTRAG